MKMPCEVIIWYALPSIRRELAKSMIQEFHLTQVETARKLGVTEAAVSQYMRNKRGTLPLKNKKIQKEISSSAKRLAKNGGDSVLMSEICRICKELRDTEFMQKLYREHGGQGNCSVCED